LLAELPKATSELTAQLTAQLPACALCTPHQQVEGLQSEYARVADNVAGEEPAGSAATTTHDTQPDGKSEEAVAASKLSDEEVAQMRKLVSSLQEMNSTLNVR
jgi:hypothetical protein